MKKTLLIIVIVLCLGVTSFAQGGMFQKGAVPEEGNNRGTNPMMPNNHGADGDFSGNGNQNNGPIGSGVAVLMGLGAAYLVAKKRREE